MANTLKKKSPPKPDPAQLKPEKEVQVTVKEVIKDERTYKIAGAISLLLSIFLFIAFTSYLFTWQEDQSLILKFGGIKIFSNHDVKVSNLLGVLGAYTAHNLIFKGFGLASYLFCTFFFVLGVNLLFERKIFSLARNLKYMIIGLLVLSVAFSFFTNGSGFSWGGAVGELLEQWLIKWIGKVGTGFLLGLAVLCYVIWRFNPKFKIPDWKFERKKQQVILPTEQNDEPEILVAEPIIEKKSNKIKTGTGVSVIMPAAPEEEEDPMNEISMVERDLPLEINDYKEEKEENILDESGEIDPEPVFENPAPSTKKIKLPDEDLDLVIKESAQDDDEDELKVTEKHSGL